MTEEDRTLGEELQNLIDDEKEETVYQKFLEKNTRFVPREFLLSHQIHFNLLIRKPRITDKYVPDFLYLTKNSKEWNCVFIELEKPQTKTFKSKSRDFHNEIRQGINQISNWKAWFESEENRMSFKKDFLHPILIKSGVYHNPINYKYILVTGRKKEFEGKRQRVRKLTGVGDERVKIRSYDSLLEGYKNQEKLYLASKVQDRFKILSDHFSGWSLFSWTDPKDLIISEELKQSILELEDDGAIVPKDDGFQRTQEKIKEYETYKN